MGLIALILGVASLVCAFAAPVAGYGYFAIVAPLVAVVLSALAKKKGSNLGTAALVVSIIALVVGAITFAACFACASCAGEVGNAINDSFSSVIG